MLTPFAVALVLCATEIELPVKDLTDAQREKLQPPRTARVTVSELTEDQLRTARDGLQRQLDDGDFKRKAAGLITAGSLTLVGGALVAGFGLAVLFVPYVSGDGFFAMFVGGMASAIAGTVMLGVGIGKAGTRASYLERIEELDAQLKTRGAFRDGTSPRGPKKLAAPVIRFTIAEF